MPFRKPARSLLNTFTKRAIRRRAGRAVAGSSQELRQGPSHRTVALIVASALFMEQLDGTVLATALPKMAESFGTAPLNMNVALTSYLLSLAVFIPISGKVADRFGSRTVFCSAIALFTVGSMLCGLATSLPFLVASRIVQGIGGAMMVPIGRLVLLRSVSKAELVGAMTWLMVPAQIGPILGPPLGGFLVSTLSWHWIFYINVPIGVLGIVLALRLIPNVRETRPSSFDVKGLLLSGVSLSCLMFGLETVARGEASAWFAITIVLVGLGSGALYVRHARRHPEPVLDFRLMAVPTFGLSVLGGGLSRIAAGAIPFLLPMMLQLGFGWSALSSGLVTFASSAGSMLMRLSAKPALRRWGFRRVMIWNGVIASLFLAGTAALRPSWPISAIYGLLLVGGFFQSLQFIAYNTIAYADIPQPQMSAATSFYTTFQQLNLTLGICVASGALATSMAVLGHHQALVQDYSIAFLVVTALSFMASPLCARLPAEAGRQLSGHSGPEPASPGPGRFVRMSRSFRLRQRGSKALRQRKVTKTPASGD
ncbi:MAG: MFS transporter [Janthinobacterium lividum]